MKLYSLLPLLAAVIVLTTTSASAVEEQRPEVNVTRLLVFYDRTQEAHYLFPYTFRILVLEDIAGSGGLCWATYPNGTTALNPERCVPVAGQRVRIYYAELKESVEVVTDQNGVAEAVWRIYTYPKASFRVEITTSDYVYERVFSVDTRLWTLAAVTSFSAMVSALVYTLRRGLW